MRGIHEIPPRDGISYVGAVDLAGGGADRSTISIVHAEGKASERRVAQDLIKGYGGRNSAVDLEGMVAEMAAILARYRLHRVIGDKYAAGWTRQRFKAEGVVYEDAEKTTSEAFLEAEPFFAAGRIEILDHPEQSRELKALERRARVGGKAIVEHPPGGHDDFAASLCRAAAAVSARALGTIAKNAVIFSLADGRYLRSDVPGGVWRPRTSESESA